MKHRGAIDVERLDALRQLIRRIRALGGDGVEIMARKPHVPGDMGSLIAAALQLVETHTAGTQVPPPRGKAAKHPGPSVAAGHGRLLRFCASLDAKAKRAH